MIRDAIYFGLWAAICLLLTAAAFFGVLPPLLDNPYFMKLFALMAMLTAAVAGLGWFVMHRDGTRPSWRCCAGLAASTVVVSHIIIHSAGYYIFVEENMSVVNYVRGLVLTFLYHGWITVPIAFAGTALFVLWRRRGKPT